MRSQSHWLVALTVRLLALTLVAAWLAAPLLPLAARAQDAPVQPVAGEEPAATKPCSSCHSDETAAWRTSPHAMPANPSTFAPAAACESCRRILSVPVADPDIVRRRPALPCFDILLQAHEERRPLGAAVFGELHRLAPVLVGEADDGVVALL